MCFYMSFTSVSITGSTLKNILGTFSCRVNSRRGRIVLSKTRVGDNSNPTLVKPTMVQYEWQVRGRNGTEGI